MVDFRATECNQTTPMFSRFWDNVSSVPEPGGKKRPVRMSLMN